MRMPLLGLAVMAALFLVGDTVLSQGEVTLFATGSIAGPGEATAYRLVLTNPTNAVADVVLSQVLPVDFSYIPGSTVVRVNGQPVSYQSPAIDGQKLTWPSFRMPAATYISTSHFGIHTFVQDLCLQSYVDFQLDKALELVGAGGYVKQLFYSIKPNTTGAKECWVQFVNGAYDRYLTPIIRLQGPYDSDRGYWIRPVADAPGDYTTISKAYRRVVESLPRRDGHTLYIEVWNEPELPVNWSNSPSAREYGHFFVDVATAIRAIGDPRIKILNGGLTPGNASFASELMKVSGFAQSFDLWAAHCYPYNHPPNYNIHNSSARYPEYTIDSYLLERDVLARYGRPNVKVILTETGHGLGDRIFDFEGYAPINENNRADYMVRAFRDYWKKWPELLAACPFELVEPYGNWGWMDWLYPTTDVPHKQYTSIAQLPKPSLQLSPATAEVIFQARVASEPGTYYSTLQAIVNGTALPPLEKTAPVRVIEGLVRIIMPVITKGSPLSAADASDDGLVDSIAGSPNLLDESPGELKYTILQSAQQVPLSLPAMEIKEISSGYTPLALASSLDGDEVYMSTVDRQLLVVEAESGSVKPLARSPFALDAIALDGARLYGVSARENEILSFDVRGGQFVSSMPISSGPVGVAVDSQKGLVYVACAETGSIAILDRQFNIMKNVQISDAPLLGLALHARAGRIYVLLPLVPGRHGIAVLDQDTLEQIDLLGGDYEHPLSGLYEVSVDPISGFLVGLDRGKWICIDPDQRLLMPFGQLAESVSSGRFYLDPKGGKVCVFDSGREFID